MGKQIDKVAKKHLNDATENGMKTIPANQIFSSGNCLMMMITVFVAIIVTAVIVKATELQTLNDEKDATIDSLAAETEELKQKLYKAISDSKQQMKVKENSIEKLNSKIKLVNAERDKSNEEIGEIKKQIDTKNNIIDKLNTQLKDFNHDFINLNENLQDEKSRNSLLIEENNAINTKIAQNIEKIRVLTKKEKENNSVIKEQEIAMEKSTIEIETNIKEFNELKNTLEKEGSKKDNDLNTLKLNMEGKITKLTEEKIYLERTISSNLGVSEKEKMSMEKQHQNALAKSKSEEENAIKQLKDTLAAKERDIVEKSSIINTLKEQNLQVSEDLAKYSDEIQTQIRARQNEKEKCEADSKESEQKLMSKLEKEEQNAKNILQDKENMETMLSSKYKMLEKEKVEKVDILENNRNQLLDNLKKEKSEKNVLVDEKVQLVRQIEDSKLEISQLEDKIKVVQVDVGNCIVEKREEKGKLDNLENIIFELKNEKHDIEYHCAEISKELEQMKIKDANINSEKESKQDNAKEKNDE